LKNNGPIRHLSLPTFARILTVASLAALGLLIAGVRGPAGDSPALAQDRPVQTPPAAGAEAYNLAFVPADARMLVAVRPQSLLQRRDILSLLKSLRDAPMLMERIPVPPEDIEQVLVFWESGGGGGRDPIRRVPSGVVLRTSKSQNWKETIGKMAGPGIAEARQDGQTYLRLDQGGPLTWGVYTPDDRTLVAAQEVVLRELIADRNAPPSRHPWDEAWQKVARGQVMLALDTRWLRRELAQASAGPGQAPGAMLKFETFAPLYEKAQSYAASLVASDRSLAIDLVAAAGSAENARPVAETLQAIVTLGKNAAQGLRRELDRRPGGKGEALDWALEAAD
jgi:hypothetical protein